METSVGTYIHLPVRQQKPRHNKRHGICNLFYNQLYIQYIILLPNKLLVNWCRMGLRNVYFLNTFLSFYFSHMLTMTCLLDFFVMMVFPFLFEINELCTEYIINGFLFRLYHMLLNGNGGSMSMIVMFKGLFALVRIITFALCFLAAALSTSTSSSTSLRMK